MADQETLEAMELLSNEDALALIQFAKQAIRILYPEAENEPGSGERRVA